MHIKQAEDIDQLFKDKLQGLKMDYDADHWIGIEQTLNQLQVPKPWYKKHSKKAWFAGSLLVLLTILSLLLFNKKEKQVNQTFTVTPVNVADTTVNAIDNKQSPSAVKKKVVKTKTAIATSNTTKIPVDTINTSDTVTKKAPDKNFIFW